MKFLDYIKFNISKTQVSMVLMSLCLLLSVSHLVNASQPGDNARVKIKNFGQVDENLYRGAQPDREDFQSLARLGIKTVIDLREDATDYEMATVKAAGMKYINIPMRDKAMPKDRHTIEFLKLVNNTSNGPYYVHCAGGRHRTGVMVAAYRISKYNWTIDQAYQEMKTYDFYTSRGHGDFKDYIYRYYDNYVANHQVKSPTLSPKAVAVEAHESTTGGGR